MIVSEIVGRDVETLTNEEKIYILNAKIKETYIYSKDDDCFTFSVFEDGSVTKYDGFTDDEIASSLEEMEQLKGCEYSVENVTNEYTFEEK